MRRAQPLCTEQSGSRAQSPTKISCLGALPTRLSFLLCSGSPSKSAHSEFPVHHNQLKIPLSLCCLLSGPAFSFLPSQPRDLLPASGCVWSRSKAEPGSSLEELCALPRRRRCSGSCWETSEVLCCRRQGHNSMVSSQLRAGTG